eukprot:767853-Hanusia_phi.AAC.1
MSSKEAAWGMAAGMGIAALIGGGAYMLGMQVRKRNGKMRHTTKEKYATMRLFCLGYMELSSHGRGSLQTQNQVSKRRREERSARPRGFGYQGRLSKAMNLPLPLSGQNCFMMRRRQIRLASSDEVVNVKILTIKPVISPTILVEELSNDTAYATVRAARKCIGDILSGMDDRLLVVVGPCSIHDPGAAIDYANRLVKYRTRLRVSV